MLKIPIQQKGDYDDHKGKPGKVCALKPSHLL